MQNKKLEQTCRNSSFELLRIISMLLIVCNHYAVYEKFNFSNTVSFNRCLIQFLHMGGKFGVNCFVLITGYFRVSSKFKVKKVLKVILATLFYSITFLIIFYQKNMEMKIVISSIFPIIFYHYWFISVYIILYLISPILNIALNNIDKKIYIKIIILLFFIWCVIPTVVTSINYLFPYLSLKAGGICFSNLGWFIFLYMVGGYIRKYDINLFKDSRVYLLISIGLYICIFLFEIFFDLLAVNNKRYLSNLEYLRDMNMIPLVLSSISLFLFFESKNFKSKSINLIGSSTFGIYLIHENAFVRPYLWNNIFNCVSLINSKLLVVYAIKDIGIVFIVCSIIEIIRIKFLEKSFFKLLDYRIKN